MVAASNRPMKGTKEQMMSNYFAAHSHGDDTVYFISAVDEVSAEAILVETLELDLVDEQTGEGFWLQKVERADLEAEEIEEAEGVAARHAASLKQYLVSNTRGGMDLGTFEAASEYHAYVAMVRDAGYKRPSDVPGNEDLEEGEIPDDIKITRLDD